MMWSRDEYRSLGRRLRPGGAIVAQLHGSSSWRRGEDGEGTTLRPVKQAYSFSPFSSSGIIPTPRPRMEVCLENVRLRTCSVCIISLHEDGLRRLAGDIRDGGAGRDPKQTLAQSSGPEGMIQRSASPCSSVGGPVRLENVFTANIVC